MLKTWKLLHALSWLQLINMKKIQGAPSPSESSEVQLDFN